MTDLSDLFPEPIREESPLERMTPREYQTTDHNECFRLWDSGVNGVLTRIFTGGGKTFCACLKIRSWLDRGPNYRAMVLSYEQELVWQFAQEIEEFLGMTPGIEMADDHQRPDDMPRIIVASRASLLPHAPPSMSLKKDLLEEGISDTGSLSEKACLRIFKWLKRTGDTEAAKEEIKRINSLPESHGGFWSRLHKFDRNINWLVIFDEAHKHAYKLKSVKHIVDWFDANALSKRNGLTATPKRGDGVSLGHKMFPAISVDYPLFHATKACAVKEGWAVPYIQKYIEVEGVDFKNLKKMAGDFDEAELERILGEEGQLAKLVQPLLDMVGDRRTLIFSPGKLMSKNVAMFINARSETECPECHLVAWHATKLIGEESICKCGFSLQREHITKGGEQACQLDGDTSDTNRKTTYKAHRSGKFQFLSVCGLCREGYNDPDIACVAVFRPVSKNASSLAEQMKGRSCRPLRCLVKQLNALADPAERVKLIANSDKPNALIVDLVGITGLADCASTIQIYADGLDDEAIAIAEEILEESTDEIVDIQEVVEEAKRRADEEKEKAKAEKEEKDRKAREEAEKRAKAKAEVKYTAHEMGVGSNLDPNGASEGQIKFIHRRGMEITKRISFAQARRIIGQLKMRVPFDEIATKNHLTEIDWQWSGPSDKQTWKIGSLGMSAEGIQSSWDASQLIDAKLNRETFVKTALDEISSCHSSEDLTACAKGIAIVKRALSTQDFQDLVQAGQTRRKSIGTF